MAEVFDPKQILEIAAKVKENSERLFEVLERTTTHEELKALWAQLRKDAEVKAKVLGQMAQNISEYFVYEMVSGEYNSYLREIAPNYNYTQELIARKARELFPTSLEAIEFVIYVKIESVLAYSALKDYTLPNKLDMLNTLIGDEKRLMLRLTSIKKQFRQSGSSKE